jgi:hypothetical protein
MRTNRPPEHVLAGGPAGQRGSSEEASHDEERQRDTIPPVPPASMGLPFRSARRNTPTMVSPQQRPNRVETVNMMSPAVAAGAAPLPFKPARIPTPPATPNPAPALPFKAATDATAPSRAPADNARLALPFRADVQEPPSRRMGRLTLEQFASLAAELAVWPAAVPQVRARYGLDEAALRGEQALWQQRFSNDRELFARYAALFQHYRDWLERRP